MGAFGTGPQRLVDLFHNNWQQTRTGRADVTDLVRDGSNNPSSDPTDGKGVLVLRDREDVHYDTAIHDLIHCYHPEANPFDIEDNGYSEQRVVENVQVDIDVTDRTNHDTDPPERLVARDRLVGLRGDVTNTDEPPYPGLFGEVKYILETVRRGMDEYDRVSHEVINTYLGNSNATVSLRVELEQIATNVA